MSYNVRVPSSIQRRINAWNLPDPVFVEVVLRLRELSTNPAEKLVRRTEPFDGMTYAFRLVDPTNRLREYTFAFQIVYGQDEETLQVANCTYYVFGL